MALIFPGVLLAILVLVMWQNRQAKKEDSLQHTRELNILREQGRQNYEVLNKFAEAIEYLGGQQADLNKNIETNRFCPVARANSGVDQEG